MRPDKEDDELELLLLEELLKEHGPPTVLGKLWLEDVEDEEIGCAGHCPRLFGALLEVPCPGAGVELEGRLEPPPNGETGERCMVRYLIENYIML